MSALLQQVQDRLNTRLKIDLFLFQCPTSNALCIPRYGVCKSDEANQLVILVSQHFLNELNPVEQQSILGHELGHLLHEHVHTPGKAILESQFPLAAAQDIKSNVLNWMICAEVSCDIVGYLSCGCDAEAFSRAMLKYTTGLTAQTMHADDRYENLFELLLQQFEEIWKAPFDTILTTHPLTPLRLKIVSAVSDSSLVQHYGKPVPEETLAGYKSDFNAAIDVEVRKIYPRIVPTRALQADDILSELCIAVALADGRISRAEVTAIGKILRSGTALGLRLQKTYGPIIDETLSPVRVRSITNEIVDRALRETKQRHYRNADIMSILRQLVIVAASDGKIEPCELDTIYRFARPFGVSKQGILLLIERLGLH